MTAAGGQARRDVIARHVAVAVSRHRDQAAFVRLMAGELPSRERPAWIAVADALETGDIPRGTAAAEALLAAWIPFFASPGGDPRLPARILQTSARPQQGAEPRWLLVAYPAAIVALALGLLALLSATVLTTFASMFREFGIQLPLVTRAALAITPFMMSIWQPLLAAAAIIVVGRWLSARWSAGSSMAAATFTRSLARLVAGGIPTDEAVALAGQVVNTRRLDLARPRRPLTYAASAALDCEPRTAAILLDAVAACHEDRVRGAIGLGQWYVGPALIVVVGLVVGFVLLALLLPLLNLVSALS